MGLLPLAGIAVGACTTGERPGGSTFAPDNFFHSCGNPWEIDAIYVVAGGDGVLARASGGGKNTIRQGDAQVAVFWGTLMFD